MAFADTVDSTGTSAASGSSTKTNVGARRTGRGNHADSASSSDTARGGHRAPTAAIKAPRLRDVEPAIDLPVSPVNVAVSDTATPDVSSAPAVKNFAPTAPPAVVPAAAASPVITNAPRAAAATGSVDGPGAKVLTWL